MDCEKNIVDNHVNKLLKNPLFRVDKRLKKKG